ncbi:hypothetical protein [Bacillus sp. FJAT-49736]|uniref:hypothetical protein n=1 Tax=Bacillus sp. FJAT-49736 TaxID=2833582 RepID=UPI001BC9BA00|nr:hypothetical protein [Bacillus sp. FJAT-49736]MBS4172861.1 hypothetical protein [Bacillus sp. FJAT-49736]
MKKIISILGVGLLSVGVLAACSDTSDVSTGGKNNATNQEAKKQAAKADDSTKKFNAGVSKEFNGMKVSIADVKITKKNIQVGLNIQNTTSNTISMYPDQGHLVIGDLQLEANMFDGTGDVSGDISGGVKKDGVIVFDAPQGKTLDVKKIKSIAFHMGQILDNKTFKNIDDAVVTIPVK